MIRPTGAPTLLAMFLLAAAGPALAQPDAPSPAAGSSADDRGARFSFDPGPTFELGPTFRIQLGGRLDADVRTGPRRDVAEDDGLELTGHRLELSGRVTRHVSFELSSEVGAERPWRDVFVDVSALRALAVRAGRFKVPFSEERLRGIGKLDFVNRSYAARVLAPGRAQGVMVFGDLPGKTVSYEVGGFGGGPRETGSEDVPGTLEPTRPMVAMRVTSRPAGARKDAPWWLRPLRVGGSLTRGWNPSGYTTLDARTLEGDAPMLEPVFVRGPRNSVGLDTQWAPGPVRVNAEWMQVRDARLGQGIDGNDLPDLVGRGWYVSGAWQVVKHRDRDGWVQAHVFREVEIAGRIESIAFGAGRASAASVVHPRAEAIPWQTLRALTIGATWRWNRYSRVLANAIVEEPETTWPGGPDRKRYWSGVTRLQFTF
jgi:hypothetical protein